MKPDRLEDLGRIRELMERLLSDYDQLEACCWSKHNQELFVEIYAEEDRRYGLHNQLRFLFERLNEIMYIAKGDLYE